MGWQKRWVATEWVTICDKPVEIFSKDYKKVDL